ncbi:MAG: hypothetical protein JWL81_270 [Verrucomicrobiales bacterium]|nr:hypothetical protein [Verrucomicrobiales bacterium]
MKITLTYFILATATLFAGEVSKNLRKDSPDGAFKVSLIKVGETNTRRLEIADKNGKAVFTSGLQIDGTDVLDFYADHLLWSPDSKILAISAGYPKLFRTYLFAWDGKGFQHITMPNIAAGEDNPWIYPTEWSENHILQLKISGPHAGQALVSGYDGTAVVQVDLQAKTSRRISEKVERNNP